MIAVIYSGSRHADWKLSEKGQLVSEFKTVGINPYFNDERFILTLLNKNIHLINNAEKIKRIYFFGAGASSEDRKKVVETALGKFFRFGKVFVEHDMKAAALATCGEDRGIVAIIGSGSNAAYYTGKKIRENNYGLGFILADEGSSNWMGRYLLKNFLNGTMPVTIERKFTQKYHLDRKNVLDKVYRQPQPVLFLSSFIEFINENRSTDYIKDLVMKGFNDFFVKYIIPLNEKYPNVPVNFAGTVAAGFQDWIREAAANHNLEINTIVKEPIYNVLNYYSNKN
ncbi:hypothetical protein [Rubrolithibacter danxiaensis]|uniref:hypothetical protein n=1 Tax=Rubrolithibacter danxiaensis TaxID=3390805 RepID=UPI003BF85E13